MSLETFYETIGGDLPDIRARMQPDDRIIKFTGFFLQDDSFANLEAAMDAQDLNAAFRAAHSLKGIAQNMSFTVLFDAANALTDALRPDDSGQPKALEDVPKLLDTVHQTYSDTLNAAKVHLDL